MTRSTLLSQLVVGHALKDAQFARLQLVLVIPVLVVKMITIWILEAALLVHLLAKIVQH